MKTSIIAIVAQTVRQRVKLTKTCRFIVINGRHASAAASVIMASSEMKPRTAPVFP